MEEYDYQTWLRQYKGNLRTFELNNPEVFAKFECEDDGYLSPYLRFKLQVCRLTNTGHHSCNTFFKHLSVLTLALTLALTLTLTLTLTLILTLTLTLT